MFKIESPVRAMRLLASAWFIVAVVCAGSALAQSPPGGGKGKRGPPQEALAACKSLSTGDACSFTARETHEGTCQALEGKSASEGKALACRPSDAPDPGSRNRNRPSR